MPRRRARQRAVATTSGDEVQNIHHQLQELGYITSDRPLVAQVHMLLQFSRMTRRAVPAMLLQGPPGTGKTFLAETVSKLWKAGEELIFQFTPGVTREDLMFDLDIANIATAQSGNWVGEFLAVHAVREGIFARALKASLKGRVVLLLDELDKASEKVDAFLLDYLQSCRMDAGPLGMIHGNPQNLLVFITMNNQRQISEPLMRRCIRRELQWPTPAVETPMVTQLAKKQLDTLGRVVHQDLTAMAGALVSLANEVRNLGQLKKVPSSPELASALVELALLPKQDWGEAVMPWLLAYEADRRLAASIWKKSAKDIATQIQNAINDAQMAREAQRAASQVPKPPELGMGYEMTPGVAGPQPETVEGIIAALKRGESVGTLSQPLVSQVQAEAIRQGITLTWSSNGMGICSARAVGMPTPEPVSDSVEGVIALLKQGTTVSHLKHELARAVEQAALSSGITVQWENSGSPDYTYTAKLVR